MKYFGLAALALAMSVGASASTVVVNCSPTISQSVTFTPSAYPQITCAAFNTLGGTLTLTGESVAYESDFSSGATGNNSQTTTFNFSGGGLSNDSVTTTGTGTFSTSGSDTLSLSTQTSVNGAALFGPEYVQALTSGVGSAFTVNGTTVMGAGNALGITGIVQEVFTYTATQTTAPEPGSMMLLGSGLVAFALAGRKLVRK
jgi:hypothetical protein